ncbi:MAG: hypothetical protein ACE5Q6_11695 [Dehalococcoidia bacterium]
MQKSQRDSVLRNLSHEERQNFRRVLTELRTQLKTSPGQRITAREMLETTRGDLPQQLRSALETIMVRDETGPKIGETPRDFNLKLMGSQERVRLSSFAGKKPVALAFGSYT